MSTPRPPNKGNWRPATAAVKAATCPSDGVVATMPSQNRSRYGHRVFAASTLSAAQWPPRSCPTFPGCPLADDHRRRYPRYYQALAVQQANSRRPRPLRSPPDSRRLWESFRMIRLWPSFSRRMRFSVRRYSIASCCWRCELSCPTLRRPVCRLGPLVQQAVRVEACEP